MKDRKHFLDTAEALINGDRAKEYGPAKENHERIAKMWSVLLDTDEYVDPSVHGAHVTSDVALPATDTPCPAGHFDHGVHVAYDADEAIHAPLPW